MCGSQIDAMCSSQVDAMCCRADVISVEDLMQLATAEAGEPKEGKQREAAAAAA